MVGLLSGMLLNPDLIVSTALSVDGIDVAITLYIYIGVAFITCLFPLAGTYWLI